MNDAPVIPAEAAPAAPEAAPVEAVTQSNEPAEQTPEEKKESRTYTQEELDRITAKVKKNERYRTKKEIEAYYLGRESVAPREPQGQPQQTKETAPSRESFETYEQYLEAKAEWTARRAAREERERLENETKARQRQRELTERVQTFQQKVNEKYPDLTERLEPIAHMPMPDGVAEALAESDFGPDILNHFAANHKDFERLASLSPSAALREIGKLEARFESGATKPPVTEVKKPSNAPAPIKPVGGTTVTGDSEPSHDKPEEWAAWRNRQLLKRRTGTT